MLLSDRVKCTHKLYGILVGNVAVIDFYFQSVLVFFFFLSYRDVFLHLIFYINFIGSTITIFRDFVQQSLSLIIFGLFISLF